MIYFADNKAGLIKIGYAANVEKRFGALRTVVPSLVLIGSMEGKIGHERTIHDCLAIHRREGEWFTDCAEVRQFIHRAIKEGVKEWKPARTRNFTPSMWDVRAKRLIDIVAAGRPKSEFAAIEREFDIPAGTLWNVRYRQSREISVGEYFALVAAAREAIKRRQSELDRAAAFVSDLEREDADKDDRMFECERQMRKLKNEIAITNPDRVGTAQALVREIEGKVKS